MSRRGDDLRMTHTLKSILDDGVEALGTEMGKMVALSKKHKEPLIDHQAKKLCDYVRATVWMAEEERKQRANPGEGDLVGQVAEALKDPEFFREVQKRMGQERAS